eukprot:CAMPEP_0113562974 /NCGR_PEP_ID=MMETSP0015_2-20120614/20809_1 /TAXON_ID=2838 /ORGANISM="Odontella" /LENGTH=265 /DNA_ID=CAMNT_0000464899 /DNA_START=17 /DNA_END=811 /DNA_ORIENTATION=+ /assembly_acc=CAM_ASM_000160
MNRIIGPVVSSVVGCVDVDGVVRQIDVDDALDRVDVNHLLDRVDINRHLQRVDLDALLDRVDLDRLIDKSNIASIVARSSTGIFDQILDGLRAKVAIADQAVQKLGRCRCCSKQRVLPPRPGESRKIQKEGTGQYPSQAAHLAVELQGRYVGMFPRFLAWFCDQILMLSIFAIFFILLEIVVKMATNKEDFNPRAWTYVPIAYVIWELSYTVVSLTLMGRTIGMTIFGLLVVTTTGKRIGPIRALLRTSLTLLSVVTIIGALIGW